MNPEEQQRWIEKLKTDPFFRFEQAVARAFSKASYFKKRFYVYSSVLDGVRIWTETSQKFFWDNRDNPGALPSWDEVKNG